MLTTLLAPFLARERLKDEVAALGTRVSQLERERSALSLEHAERVSALDALVRRLSTRIQRAEANAAVELANASAGLPEAKERPSVLAARRSMRGY